MSDQWNHARQTKYAAYAAIYTLVILAVIVVANVLANRYDKSYDGTSNKRYSLSDQTKKVVAGLKQDATITYFDQASRFQPAKDSLQQYADLSRKIHVDYVDPDKSPQLARANDIKEYGTALVQIGDRKEQVKGLTEQDITGAIIRDLKTTTRTVCFVAGSGEHQIDDSDRTGYSGFKDLLGKEDYQTEQISLLEKAEAPSDCTVLVIGGPTGNYLQPEVDAIKKYVENGGRALLMLDPPLKIGRTNIADNDALTDVLASWGVTAQKNMILDQNPVSQLLGVGNDVALVTSYTSQPIVNDLKRTATGFPLARSLEVKNGDKTSVEKLFDSSDTSLATADLHSAQVNGSDPKNQKGPLTIGAAGTYNTGKEDSQGRFVVIGSSDWATNSFLNFNGNSDLALNAVDWLASDENMISIRPKPPEDQKITMTGAQLALVRSVSQFLLPLAVVFAGASVWWRRR